MQEIALVAGILGILGGGLWGHRHLEWQTLLEAGAGLIALGLLIGVPTGFHYHVLLRKAVLRKGPLPKDWWLFPGRYHAGLSDAEIRPMKVWFRAGAAGFFLALAGCGVLLIAMF